MKTLRKTAHDKRVKAVLCELTECLLKAHGPAASRLANRCPKKAKIGSSKKEETIARFLDLNSQLEQRRVDLPARIVSDAREFIRTALERATNKVHPEWVQTSLDLDHVIENWKLSSGSSYGLEWAHPARKMNESWDCTALARPLVFEARSRNPYLASFDAKYGPGTCVEGSRLTTVLKNQDTDRTITIEPLGNMALQLAAGDYLVEALSCVGIHIRGGKSSLQWRKNKLLAKIYSINGQGATVDLKEASNYQLPGLIKLLYPAEWFELLWRLRSPKVWVHDRWVKLHMMSGMGNGFTFPLMTLTIAALIYAVSAQYNKGRLWVDWNECGVFGDDIIVPLELVEPLYEVLAGAGYVVNFDKSYVSGPFRESCGGDYWNGQDITPVYIKSLLHDHDIYKVINRLVDWAVTPDSTLDGCSRLVPWSVLKMLISYLTEGLHLVPEWEAIDSGLRTQGCSRHYTRLRSRVEKTDYRGDLAFSLPLAIGGYVEQQGSSCGSSVRPKGLKMTFTERNATVITAVEKARLPQGWTSGWDPKLGGSSEASKRELIIHLLTS